MAENTWGLKGAYVALDEDGEVLHSPRRMDADDVDMLVRKWQANGFKPDDYSLRYYREQGSNGGGSE